MLDLRKSIKAIEKRYKGKDPVTPTVAGQTMEIKVGTIGYDLDSRKRVSPKYRFNTTVTLPLLGTAENGPAIRPVVLVEGKRIMVV